MSPIGIECRPEASGFPRVSGDEPKTATPKQPHFKFSPRERG